MHDPDARISLLACELCLVSARVGERDSAVLRLMALLPEVDWMLRDEVQNVLRTYVQSAR